MKRLIIIIALVMTATVVSATENPIDKGSWILTGNAYFMSQHGDLYNNADGEGKSWINLAPSAGYFVAPGILIGADTRYTMSSQGDNKTTDFLLGPMVGFYFHMDPRRTEVKGAVYPFAKGFFLFGSEKFKADLFEETTTMTAYGGEAGLLYMLSGAVGLNFQANLTKLKNDYDDDIVDPEVLDSENGTVFQIGVGVTAFVY